MPDDSGRHRHRSGNVTNGAAGEDANPPPLTTEEFEALLRTATANDTGTETPSQLDTFDLICLAAPTLAGLTMLAWIWLSRQFD